eukprot:1149367-Pelagomonas_calceolata.AAC.3
MANTTAERQPEEACAHLEVGVLGGAQRVTAQRSERMAACLHTCTTPVRRNIIFLAVHSMSQQGTARAWMPCTHSARWADLAHCKLFNAQHVTAQRSKLRRLYSATSAHTFIMFEKRSVNAHANECSEEHALITACLHELACCEALLLPCAPFDNKSRCLD